MQFAWNPQKAAENLRKHRISFDEAKTVFFDPLARIHDDPDHSKNESREIIVGTSVKGRLLIISFTEHEDVVRIISARRADLEERHDYEESNR